MSTLWGIEWRGLEGWITYYALYPSKEKATAAIKNARPVNVEWRVVEYQKSAM